MAFTCTIDSDWLLDVILTSLPSSGLDSCCNAVSFLHISRKIKLESIRMLCGCRTLWPGCRPVTSKGRHSEGPLWYRVRVRLGLAIGGPSLWRPFATAAPRYGGPKPFLEGRTSRWSKGRERWGMFFERCSQPPTNQLENLWYEPPHGLHRFWVLQMHRLW